MRLSDYKVKIIQGIDNGELKYAIIPTKVAPDFWLFSCDTKNDARKFVKKIGWILV